MSNITLSPSTVHFAKRQLIQQKGELNSKVYRVKKGLLRSYTIDEKGREHIFMFAPEEWIICDNCPPEEPCELFIDAVEDSDVEVLDKDLTREPDFKKLVKRLQALQRRMLLLMSAPAIERYEYFCETYPQILQRVPQRMVASYLGITPEALSKVKSDKAKENLNLH